MPSGPAGSTPPQTQQEPGPQRRKAPAAPAQGERCNVFGLVWVGFFSGRGCGIFASSKPATSGTSPLREKPGGAGGGGGEVGARKLARHPPAPAHPRVTVALTVAAADARGQGEPARDALPPRPAPPGARDNDRHAGAGGRAPVETRVLSGGQGPGGGRPAPAFV